MRGTTRYQAQRHPVAAFLVVLLLSPYILAFLLLYGAAFLAVAAAGTLGRK